MTRENPPWTDELLRFWFGPLNDSTQLDREQEPFRTQMRRWYGKDPAVDDEIRQRFEPTLLSVTSSGQSFASAERAVANDPRAQLALILLVDQLPRNMYRDTPRMYTHDDVALAYTYRTLPTLLGAELSLLERMFALVPLMHAENLTLQDLMCGHFVQLCQDAEARSLQNLGFYQYALDYARRHRDVVARFGRFPHRNSILGRKSTPEEQQALDTESIAF